MIREFRVPVGDYVIGLPAGLIDAGESVENDGAPRDPRGDGAGGDGASSASRQPLFSSSGLTDEAAAMAFVEVRGDPAAGPHLEPSECLEVLLPRPRAGVPAVRRPRAERGRQGVDGAVPVPAARDAGVTERHGNMPRGLLLCDDLIFISRVTGTAKTLGLEVSRPAMLGALVELARQVPRRASSSTCTTRGWISRRCWRAEGGLPRACRAWWPTARTSRRRRCTRRGWRAAIWCCRAADSSRSCRNRCRSGWSSSPVKALVVGGGIGGLACATALGQGRCRCVWR